MKQVLLVTTPGCEACNIMKNIISKVKRDNNYDFKVKTESYDKLPEFIKINVKMTDFPVTILLQGVGNELVIKYHFSGTISAKEFQTIINDLNFN